MSVDADLGIQKVHLQLEKRTNFLKKEKIFLKTPQLLDWKNRNNFWRFVCKWLKSLFPKRFISTFDVFEKTAKNRIEAFFCEYFVNFTFWGLQTYNSSSKTETEKFEKLTIFSLGFILVCLSLKKWIQGVLKLNLIKFRKILFYLKLIWI